MELSPGDDIRDGEHLFRYCRPEAFPVGQREITLSIFSDGNLSCDWKRLQLAPAASPRVAEGKSLILEIEVCDAIRNPFDYTQGRILEICCQRITYDPVNEPGNVNDAHSLISGRKKPIVQNAIALNTMCFHAANPEVRWPAKPKEL